MTNTLPNETTGTITRIDGNTTVNLFYSATGDLTTGPVMLFVHGAGSDYRIWHCQRKYYCNKYATLAVDLRGYGNSSQPLDSNYSYIMWAADIKAVLDALNVTSVIFFGGNFGAQIGLRFVATYPGIVQRMILAGGNPLTLAATRDPSINPGPSAWEYAEFTPAEISPVYQLLLGVAFNPTNPQVQAGFQFFLQTTAARIFPDLCTNVQPLRDYVISIAQNTPALLSLRMLGYNNPNSWVFEDLFPILPTVRDQNIPILIVTGSENASFSRGYGLTLFLKLMQPGIPAPGASTPLIRQFVGDGNYVYAAKVDKFNDAVDEFLNYDQYATKCDICKNL